MKSRIRSGPMRGSSAAISSSWLRPCSGECGSPISFAIIVETTNASSASVSASEPWPAAMPGQAQQRLPLGLDLRVGRQRRRRVVGHVARGELVEGQVVVDALQRRGRRQDHVGVPGRLVDVDVDADHQLERVERGGQPARVGRRDGRVAGDREQRAHLPLAGRLDLVGQRRDRQLSEHLVHLADTAGPATELDAATLARLALGVGGGRGGLGEHRAAGPVEVAGRGR